MATISYMIEHEVATSKADPLCILRMKEKKKRGTRMDLHLFIADFTISRRKVENHRIFYSKYLKYFVSSNNYIMEE